MGRRIILAIEVKEKGGNIMGIIAERTYTKENKNKRKETEEEREYKLARIYNKIFFAISNVKTAQDYLKMRNAISAYASEAGVEYASEVKRLTKMLNERIIEIEIELEKNINKLNTEIEEIKNDKLNESVEHLQELNTIADQRMLQYMMKLDAGKDNNERNKRRIGNFVALVEKNSDRADAMAMTKLAMLPQFSDCFTQRQKEIIAEKSLNPAHIVFERNKEMLIKEKSSQLGALYMKAFNIRNIKKKITNADSAFYFNKDREE